MFNIIAIENDNPVELTIDTALVSSANNICHMTLLYLDDNLNIKEKIISKKYKPNLMVNRGDMVVYSGDNIYMLKQNVLEPLNPNISSLTIDESVYEAIVSSCKQLYYRLTYINNMLQKGEEYGRK